jgi:hypothetical protein
LRTNFIFGRVVCFGVGVVLFLGRQEYFGIFVTCFGYFDKFCFGVSGFVFGGSSLFFGQSSFVFEQSGLLMHLRCMQK